MKYRNLIIAAAISLLLASCKKDEGLSDGDKSSFIKSYGTSSEGVDLVQTADGGYLILGTTQGASSIDIYLKKVDAYGNPQWSKTYDGPAGQTDESAYDLELLGNGGYAISGSTWFPSTDDNAVLIKSTYLLITDYSGTLIKDFAFNSDTLSPIVEHEEGFGLEITSDGKILIASQRIKQETGTNSFLTAVVRSIEYSTWNVDSLQYDLYSDTGIASVPSIAPRDIVIINDDIWGLAGYATLEEGNLTGQNIFCASFGHPGGSDSLSWENTGVTQVGGAEDDGASKIFTNSSGQTVVLGFVTEGGLKNSGMFAIEEVGVPGGSPTVAWTFVNDRTENDECFAAVEVSGGYVLAGYVDRTGSRQMYVLKINSTGSSVLWEKEYGYVGFDEAKAVIATSDNGIAVLGTSSDERGNRVVTLLKLDANGNLK